MTATLTPPAAMGPIVTFHRLIEEVRPPSRADRSGQGGLPTRAYRHCDAVTSAAGFGWYLHAPLDLELLWDGREIWWNCAATDGWLPLEAAQYPHFAERFDAAAPPGARGYAPPLLTALPEPGVVQIWTGLLARTAPGWSLLLRGLANLPRHPGFEAYEGIVETDHWFGPLFTNLRLTRTDHPVRLHAGEPLIQAQPIPRLAYADAVLLSARDAGGMAGMQPEDWAGYHAAIVAPNQDPDRQPGSYAAEARKRRRGLCPHLAAAAGGAAPTTPPG